MNTPILSFTTGSSKDKTTRAEIKIANALVQNNIPLAFTDSDIARGYAAASTKTTCLVNGSLSPHFKSALVNTMKIQPFSVAVDGSNDTGLEKMNPMTVRLYDVNQGSIVTRFLDMCLTKGTESATAASIFKKMDDVLKENGISWSNCVGVSVDNTSVNLGKRNSIMTRVLQNNPAVYFIWDVPAT